MGITLDIKYEYEVKELIKAFGIIDFDSMELEINEMDSSIFFNLNLNGKSFSHIHKINGDTEKGILYKQGIYKIFSIALDKDLPWGILTGIRPVKLIKKLGLKTDDEIISLLKNRYYISEDKIKDMLIISKVQDSIIESGNLQEGLGIYVGIPFCPSRCNYCSFYSSDINKSKKYIKPYLEALLKEVDLVLPYIKDKLISSLYFGGGTPSSLSSDDIRYILRELNTRLNFSKIYEVSFEAGRPDTLDREKLTAIKDGMVNRISINPQTMNNKTLKLIGRNHNSEDIVNCFKEARNIGFENINMDVIIGLEDENIDDVRNTMEALKSLNPDSITVHTLAIKRASKLHENKGIFEEKDIIEQMDIAREYCGDINLIPYYLYRQKNIKGNLENIGLSKKGKASAYNIGIMEEIQTIIAFGAGGVSKFCYPKEDRIERVENVKSLEEYLKRYEEMANRKIKELNNI
ncbi:MAG: coproporphyrinogen dehydrogenase HemZ [Filifactoraceae bacterium]